MVVPFPQPRPSADTKYKLGFIKPTFINVTGSYALGVASEISGVVSVDLVVTMPTTLFTEKDYLDFRYAHKRAFYLASVAASIKASKFRCKLFYEYLNNNYLQPILAVQSAEGDRDSDFARSSSIIKILLDVPEDVFPNSKTLPDRNCLRSLKSSSVKPQHLPATPFYNASVRSDETVTSFKKLMHGASAKSAAYSDACLLGQVWLRQRGFSSSVSRGGFGNFEWGAMLALLLVGGGPNGKPLLASTYDCHQLFRAMIQILARKDFVKQPLMIEVRDVVLSKSPSGPIIFDGQRCMNILYKMTSAAYKSLRQEAQATMKFVSGRDVHAFESTFIIKVCEPCLKYDCVVQIPAHSLLHESHDHEPYSQLMEKREAIYQLLDHGLGDRVALMDVRIPEVEQWPIDTAKSAQCNGKYVSVHIVIDPKNAIRAVDRGPPPEQDSQVAEFCAFWGRKTELRRFKDGQVLQSVVWTSTSPLARTQEIIREVLSHHLGEHVIPGIRFLPNRSSLPQTDMGSVDATRQVYSTMEKDIRGLQGLPLEIRQIQLATPLIRSSGLGQLRTEHMMDVVIQFEGSGSWPDDLAAIQMTKIAFLLKVSELLEQKRGPGIARLGLENEKHELHNRSFLDVMYGPRITFRLRIHHEREEMLLERLLAEKEIPASSREDRASALAHFRRTFIDAPRHAQDVDGVSTRFPAFAATVAMTNLWMSAHLLSNHISNEVVELLVSSTFLHSAPWAAPSTETTGFLRTLLHLSRWSWQHEPLIVDFSGAMTTIDEEVIRTRFEAWRNIDPALNRVILFIATNHAKGNTWTEHRPAKVVAGRMTCLARAAFAVISRQALNLDFAALFTPSLRDYDFVLRLDADLVYGKALQKRHSQYKNLQVATKSPGIAPCVQPYLDELQITFGDALVLFHSQNSGHIAGIWSPHTDMRKWKVNLTYSTMPVPTSADSDETTMLVTSNKAAMLSEMCRLGGDMVKSVTLRE